MKLRKTSPLAIILVMAMLIGMCVPAMAATYTLSGLGLYLNIPPKGELAEVNLQVLNGTSAVDGVQYELASPVDGISFSGSKMIVDGDKVRVEGSSNETKITVVAKNSEGTQLCTYDVTIGNPRYYEDFEDGTVGGNILTTLMENLDGSASTNYMFYNGDYVGTISEETGGNNYAGSLRIYASKTSNKGYTTPIVTVSSKIKKSNAAGKFTISGNQGTATRNGPNVVELAIDANGTLKCGYSSTGTALESGSETALHTFGDNWETVDVVLNFTNHTYSVYIENDMVVEDYAMLSTLCWNSGNTAQSVNITAIRDVIVTQNIDNIAIYSGAPYELPYIISGNETILAPSEGKFAQIPYSVTDKTGSSVSGAEIELAEAYSGMTVRNNVLLVSNDITAGEKELVVKDSSGNLAGKTTVEVLPYVYYEDFEDGTVGTGITGTRIGTVSNTAEVKTMFKANVSTDNIEPLIDGDNTNKYAIGNGIADNVTENNVVVDYGNPYAIIDASLGADMPENVNSGKVTVSAKVYRTSDDGADSYPGLYVYDSKGTKIVELRFITSAGASTTAIWCKYQADGSSKTGNGDTIGTINHGRWVDISVELDFDAKKYTVYADGNVLKANEYTMANSASTNGIIGNVQFGTVTDDIAIYSGTPISIAADDARLTIPAAEEKVHTISAKYNDGTAVSNLSCSTEAKYITASKNTLSVSSAAGLVPVTVTLSDGFVTGTATFETDKSYVLLNGAEYSEASALLAGSNTIYAVHGASDMKAGNIIYIARYSKDGELTKLEKVVSSETSAQVIDATLTDAFNSGDTAKVFLWKNSTLQPIRVATEIK